MNRQSFPRTNADTGAGAKLRLLRRQANLSQLELALISGISQRHLSCIETGRAKPSPGTLHNLLSALEVESLPAPQKTASLAYELTPPLVLTRVNLRHGKLSFRSTLTTFGMPLDITVTSLRIEHLIPADAHTWQVNLISICRSELAREKPEDASGDPTSRVIVNDLREQARSYSGEGQLFNVRQPHNGFICRPQPFSACRSTSP